MEIGEMENIFSKWLELLSENLGQESTWVIFVILTLFLLLLMYERFNISIATSSSNKFKKYELFLQVFDSDLSVKNPIVIEQGFANYFGFALSFEEIQHCCNLNRPTEFINDLKRCKSSISYEDGKYEKPKFHKLKKYLSNTFYWFFSLLLTLCFYYFLESQQTAWLVPIAIFFVLAGYSLKFVSASYASERIAGNKYTIRQSGNRILLCKPYS
ncbi:hypothetical protein KB976_004906 [Vibrio parahaemolyticus]|nr:hypothetical protein [Vibrio parahaemolyticus]